MNRRAFTLVELLTGLVIFGVVLTGVFVAFISMWNAQGISIGLPASQQGANQIAWQLANAFRGATTCLATDSGCTVGSGVQSATSTGCTIYSRNSSGTLVQTTYAMSGTNFDMTSGSTTSVLSSNATVTLTYYTATTYNSTALTSYTPSSTTVADLIAVQIVVTVAQGGGSTTYTTMVRLRNGP